VPPPGGGSEDAPPQLLPQAYPLHAVVQVDYTVPGCPPPAPLIAEFFTAFLSGQLPPAGSVFAADKALCEECPRERENQTIERFVRPHQVVADPDRCLLDQGILCLGPVTRGGCQAACPRAGMPCTGCLGPTPKAGDMGMAMISALASLVRAGEEGEAAIGQENDVLDQLVDHIGSLYKYGLSPAALGRRQGRTARPAARAGGGGGGA
ncbi:MAG: hydrogenase iron-sulfur subunit, partial [Candidatus Bipolaricaulaceae bacterium]